MVREVTQPNCGRPNPALRLPPNLRPGCSSSRAKHLPVGLMLRDVYVVDIVSFLGSNLPPFFQSRSV